MSFGEQRRHTRMTLRKRLIAALTLSFSIYLVPVFTAHRLTCWTGPRPRGVRDRESAWKAADVAFA